MPIKLKFCCKRDNRVLSSSKCFESEEILRHRVVEVMTFVVFTIGGVKSGVSIVIANFIKIKNEKFKVIIQLIFVWKLSINMIRPLKLLHWN